VAVLFCSRVCVLSLGLQSEFERLTRATPAIWTTRSRAIRRAAAVSSYSPPPFWHSVGRAMGLRRSNGRSFSEWSIIPLAITSLWEATPSSSTNRPASTYLDDTRRRLEHSPALAIRLPLAILFLETPFPGELAAFRVLGDSRARDRGYFRCDETEKRYSQNTDSCSCSLPFCLAHAPNSDRRYPTGSAAAAARD